MMILLGFAAVCTAGILLPLNWTIGIRLAKEDEMEGLDAAGILLYSIKEKINKIIDYCSSW
jgi:ammonia channel protein AmtB